MNGVSVIAFSDGGAVLAAKLAAAFDGAAWASRGHAAAGVRELDASLSEWTKNRFADSSALVFVCACGIAVRAIAPFVESKTKDPAVVVLDDEGSNVIALLSGHLGGANELARAAAALTGGRAIITTASDVHGLPAVDEWAVKHDCAIEDLYRAKKVAAAAIAGAGIGVAVTDRLQPAPWPVTLWLRPRNLVLGVGCKKDTEPKLLLAAAADFFASTGVSAKSVCAVASIDIKKGEKAIKALAENLGAEFVTYTASELNEAKGTFASSEKVLEVTGTDNVCERAAVLRARGRLVRGKTVYCGATFALARRGAGREP